MEQFIRSQALQHLQTNEETRVKALHCHPIAGGILGKDPDHQEHLSVSEEEGHQVEEHPEIHQNGLPLWSVIWKIQAQEKRYLNYFYDRQN